MLRTALEFIESELNTFMIARDRDSYTSPIKPVLLTGLVKRDGSPQMEDRHIYISLTHLEEDRLENKRPVYVQNPANQKYQVLQPPVRLNAYVLFSAVKNDYPTALRDLSLVTLFFQRNTVFKSADYPNFNSNSRQKTWQHVEEISFQIYSLNYEQQSYLWSSLGSKYTPSLLFKMRVLTMLDLDTNDEAAPILEGVSNGKLL
jgi:hypothetical protein